MNSNFAHNLEKDVWRSEDISLSTYLDQSGKIEIITPSQTLLKNNERSTTIDLDQNYLKNCNSTFSSIKISAKIVDDLKRCGFIRPSPIQATAIPLGRIGIDLIAQSKSGTGKTIVFVVCALEMAMLTLNEPPCPRILITAPTREIAVQIGEIITSLTSTWKQFSCYKAIGGTKVSENISNLAKSQIIVGTPGRICCLLEKDLLKPNSIRLLVLDECDKLMDPNFKKQINKIYSYLPFNKQMIVTSATLSDEMTLFLANYMRTPALVRLNADNPALVGVMQLYLLVDGHSLEYLNFDSKIGPLLTILKDIPFTQCLIFSNYQTRAKYLYDRLLSVGWSVFQISGNMTQKERLEAINSFRKQRCKILVSTDLTARGIDIETINLIINIDVPLDSETYLHRIGRAGRFGSAGIAITIVSKGDDYRKFQSIMKEYNLSAKSITLPIKMNPWNIFYKDRLQYSRTLLSKYFSEGLAMNDQFSSIFNNYHRLRSIEVIENVDSSDFVQVLNWHGEDDSSINHQVARKELILFKKVKTVTDIIKKHNCDLNYIVECSDYDSAAVQDFDNKPECLISSTDSADLNLNKEDDQRSEQYNLSNCAPCEMDQVNNNESNEFHKLIHSTIEDCSLLSHCALPTILAQPPSAAELVDRLSNSPPSWSDQDKVNFQFKHTFLRVPLTNASSPFSSLVTSNMNICKYMLRGGKM